jgi:hypothetical protein
MAHLPETGRRSYRFHLSCAGCGGGNGDVINSTEFESAARLKAMSESPTINGFRVTAFAFACILVGLATWILAAEILCPTGIEFTTDAQSAVSIYARRDAAVLAARVGLVRGDLWSEAAFDYGDMLWNQDKNASNAEVVPFERIRALTEQAIAFAPHDSRLWLLLAANYFRFDWLNERAAASLKMSYYTGSNMMAVVPERLLLAIQSLALQDDDFQELVRHDIHVAVVRKSEMMPALIAAYNNAPSLGRQFIEKTLAELDPGMLVASRSEGQQR